MSATSVQDGDQSRAVMPRQFRTLFISDLHLGARACQAEAFLDFLRYYDPDTIYLVGDIIDFWLATLSISGASGGAPCGFNRITPYAKYIKTFGLLEPIAPSLASKKAAPFSQLRMFLEHGSIDKFRAASLFCERDPETVQKQAVRKLPSGNYLRDSRYRNWSNQAVLVERQYFLDVVCRRVEGHPDPRLVNGHQDIERALNQRWWRRRRDRMGHAAEGIFTHRRLDR